MPIPTHKELVAFLLKEQGYVVIGYYPGVVRRVGSTTTYCFSYRCPFRLRLTEKVTLREWKKQKRIAELHFQVKADSFEHQRGATYFKAVKVKTRGKR